MPSPPGLTVYHPPSGLAVACDLDLSRGYARRRGVEYPAAGLVVADAPGGGRSGCLALSVTATRLI